jgi:hypothetical protein
MVLESFTVRVPWKAVLGTEKVTAPLPGVEQSTVVLLLVVEAPPVADAPPAELPPVLLDPPVAPSLVAGVEVLPPESVEPPEALLPVLVEESPPNGEPPLELELPDDEAPALLDVRSDELPPEAWAPPAFVLEDPPCEGD